ncbi:MAG: hypothetical protein LBK65_01935 [Tannerellaceae bacterium]|jgi:hypothetical protein|nr:hypothetical protein [Tannerellaceae bacterium]
MNTQIKSVLKYWQEIIFIIAIGIMVFRITMNITIAFQQVINIIFYCIFIMLIMCLIGQFYWKSQALGLQLAFMLGFGSIWMFLAVLSDLVKINTIDGNLDMIFYLFLSIGLIITAISMPLKYFKAECINRNVNSVQ